MISDGIPRSNPLEFCRAVREKLEHLYGNICWMCESNYTRDCRVMAPDEFTVGIPSLACRCPY